LSPDFFAIYVDDLIILLKNSGLGCHIINVFIAAILFADDLALLAPTRYALQELLDICSDYCDKFCLKINVSKTKVMIFGKLSKCFESVAPLYLNNVAIENVDSWKYLGFLVVSGIRFGFSVKSDLRKFYRASKSVLNILTKPKEDVQLHLLYANCVPILTYGSNVKKL
jgi:hypothetical protein